MKSSLKRISLIIFQSRANKIVSCLLITVLLLTSLPNSFQKAEAVFILIPTEVIDKLPQSDHIDIADAAILTWFKINEYHLATDLYYRSVTGGGNIIIGDGRYVCSDIPVPDNIKNDIKNFSIISSNVEQSMKEAISTGNSTKIFSVSFEGATDLHYAIGKADIEINTTYLKQNDTFSIRILLTDLYDFEYQERCDILDLQCIALNHAYEKQDLGTLKPYNVELGFVYSLKNPGYVATITQISPPNLPPIADTPNIPPQTSSNVTNQYYSDGGGYTEGYYTGQWSNGSPNGKGKIIYSNFDDDKFYSMTFGSGESYKAISYEGDFMNGARYGQGEVIYEGGYREVGAFYGKYQAGKVVFHGTWYYPGNTYYLVGTETATSTTASTWTFETDQWIPMQPESRPSTPAEKPPAKTKVTISNFKVEQYPLPSNENLTGIRLYWENKIDGTDKILFAPFIEVLDSNGNVITSYLMNDGRKSGMEYSSVNIGTTYRVSVYAFIDGKHFNRSDAVAVSNAITVKAEKQSQAAPTTAPPKATSKIDVSVNVLSDKVELSWENTKQDTGDFNMYIVERMYVPNGNWSYSGEWELLTPFSYIVHKDTQPASFTDYDTEPATSYYYRVSVAAAENISSEKIPVYTAPKSTQALENDNYTESQNISKFTPYYDAETGIYYEEDGQYWYDVEGSKYKWDWGKGEWDLIALSGTARNKPYTVGHETEYSGTVADKRPFYKIHLYIGFPEMDTVNGRIPIYGDGVTAPIVVDGRTLVPIRAILENMGGEVEWDGENQSVKCWANGHYVQLWIDSSVYYVDYFTGKTAEECRREFDVAPILYNDRTMIPVRYVSEALGFEVEWVPNGSGNGWDMVTISNWTTE